MAKQQVIKDGTLSKAVGVTIEDYGRNRFTLPIVANSNSEE